MTPKRASVVTIFLNAAACLPQAIPGRPDDGFAARERRYPRL